MDKTQVNTLIGERLRRIMNEKGINNRTLAIKCDISTGTISKIIAGKMAPSLPILTTLAIGLEVNLDDLLQDFLSNKLSLTQKQDTKYDPLYVAMTSSNHQRIAAVFDQDYKLLGESELDGDIDLAESTSSLLSLINESIEVALKRRLSSEEKRQVHINMVAISYEDANARKRMKLQGEKQFSSVNVFADWQFTHLTNFTKAPGLSLHTDKGVAISYVANDKICKIGGWKFPFYDLGGENWIGNMAVKHAIEAHEGQTHMSDLAKNILSTVSGNIETLLLRYFKQPIDTDYFSQFSPTVIGHYNSKDKAATAIVHEGFKHIDTLIAQADKKTKEKRPILLQGSLEKLYAKHLDASRLLKKPSLSTQLKAFAKLTDAIA